MGSSGSIRQEDGGEGKQRAGESNALSLAHSFLSKISIETMGNNGCREGNLLPVVPRHGRHVVRSPLRAGALMEGASRGPTWSSPHGLALPSCSASSPSRQTRARWPSWWPCSCRTQPACAMANGNRALIEVAAARAQGPFTWHVCPHAARTRCSAGSSSSLPRSSAMRRSATSCASVAHRMAVPVFVKNVFRVSYMITSGLPSTSYCSAW
jgi:hypothetical protein